MWPSARISTELARLPKPDKPSRRAPSHSLLQTLVRVQGRVRRPVSVEWEGRSRSDLPWGSGPGRRSTDCAFSHDAEP
eukprot:1823630-Pyramimonas_sp.AAC.1